MLNRINELLQLRKTTAMTTLNKLILLLNGTICIKTTRFFFYQKRKDKRKITAWSFTIQTTESGKVTEWHTYVNQSPLRFSHFSVDWITELQSINNTKSSKLGYQCEHVLPWLLYPPWVFLSLSHRFQSSVLWLSCKCATPTASEGITKTMICKRLLLTRSIVFIHIYWKHNMFLSK